MGETLSEWFFRRKSLITEMDIQFYENPFASFSRFETATAQMSGEFVCLSITPADETMPPRSVSICA